MDENDQHKKPQSIGELLSSQTERFKKAAEIQEIDETKIILPKAISSFVVVYFGLRIELGINILELVLLSLIISLSTNKKNMNGGYCYASQGWFKKITGKSLVTVARALNNLVSKELIEKDPYRKGPHGTDKWKPTNKTLDKLMYVKQQVERRNQ